LKRLEEKLDSRFAVKVFIIFRIAFLAVMGFSAVILYSFYSEPLSAIAVQLFVMGITFSLISWAALHLLPIHHLSSLAWVQIVWDLLATSYLVRETGDLYSAFALLFTVYILLSAILLRAKGAIITALLSDTLLFVTVLASHGTSIFSNPQAVSRLLFELSLIAFFGGALASLARHRERLSSSLEKTKADLKDLSALYSTIVEHIPTGILCLSSDRSWIRFGNKAAMRILGFDPSGLSLSDTPMKSISLFDARVADETRSELQMNLSGRERTIGYNLSELPDGGILIVFQDLTDIRDLESKMRVREKLASVGQLAAGIAHEIRNPLASLSGSIQLMKFFFDDTSTTEKLMRIVLRETDRLDALIRNFLIYAKPSVLKLEEIQILKFVNELIELIKNQRGKNLAKLEWGLNIDSNLSLRADTQQLKQIFWNLLLNAIDALPRQEGRIEITATEVQKGSDEFVRISVRDSGIGISSSIQEKIFDPFFTTKTEGTGLGLSLVYQMVKAHAGNIGLQSKEGTGTTFWFELLKNGPRNVQVEAA